jgi:hypothetical protein
MPSAERTSKEGKKEGVLTVALPESLFLKAASIDYAPPDRGEAVTITKSTLKGEQQHRKEVDEPFTIKIELSNPSSRLLVRDFNLDAQIARDLLGEVTVTTTGNAKNKLTMQVEGTYLKRWTVQEPITQYSGYVNVGDEIAPYCHASVDEAGPQFETVGYRDVERSGRETFRHTLEVKQEQFTAIVACLVGSASKEAVSAKAQLSADYPLMMKAAAGSISKTLADHRQRIAQQLAEASDVEEALKNVA